MDDSRTCGVHNVENEIIRYRTVDRIGEMESRLSHRDWGVLKMDEATYLFESCLRSS